jgi:flagellar hook-associated protein 2
LVDKLVDVARGPIRQLQSKQTTLSIKKFAFQDLNTLLGNLQANLEAVDTADELSAFTTSSSIPSGVTATITGAATPGTHQVSVTSLAQSSLLNSAGFAASNTSLSGTSVDVTVGTGASAVTTTIAINSALGTDTVSGLATYITDNVAGANAWLMNTGVSSDPYSLMIDGASTGAANAVTVTVNSVTGLSFSTARTAADAAVTVDTISISSASNTLVGVLPGVDLNLLNSGFGTSTLTINRDGAAIAAKVQAVVDAYNSLDAYFDSQTGTAPGAVLSGDSTVRNVQQKIQSTVGSDYSTGGLSGIGDLGLATDKTAKMLFTSEDFTAKLGTNFSDVMTMLTGTNGLFVKLQAAVDVITDTTSGVVQARIDSIDAQVEDLTDRIAKAETRLDSYRDMLQKQFTNMELILGRYQGTRQFLDQQIAQWTKQK